jgi:F-box-like
MVTADSLNFDVLELIFSFLSGQDLASVAQVNKSFLAGALPSLYKNVWYRLREGKGYASVRGSLCVFTSL